MEFLIKPKDADKINLDLSNDTTTIGRSQRCTIKLTDAKVSRVHCALEKKGEKLIIRDMNSKNGIKVNGKLKKEYELQNGDVVLIGQAICLFRDSD